MNRPSIRDRFHLHTVVIDAGKANNNTKASIAKCETRLTRLHKNLKETNLKVEQLEMDNILLRQDISTYEACVVESLGVGEFCSKLVQTIELSKDRVERLVKNQEPKALQFLDGIFNNFQELVNL